MALKVSNETKVGALTAVAIALLILGFNFLKGRSYSGKTMLYAKFKNIDGLVNSNPVTINGFAVGSVVGINESDADLSHIVVQLKLVKDIHIPNTAMAAVKSNPLGTPSVEIIFDTVNKSNTYLKTGDTLKFGTSSGILSSLNGIMDQKLQPTIDQVKQSLKSLDNVLLNLNSIFDPNTKGNLQTTIGNANKATASIVKSTAELEVMLNAKTGNMAKSLSNVASFSKTLADSKDQVNGIMGNVQKTTETFSKMELDKTIRSMNDAIASLKNTIEKVNSNEGTMGALINDRKMYNNLSSTVNSLNLLLQDLRLNPKRYVNVSVFGKKDKGTPLMKPMTEDSVTQEQIRNKQ
jgi:phospholipid/cholesterol/gamma-HCH transport system substrate-binding protein